MLSLVTVLNLFLVFCPFSIRKNEHCDCDLWTAHVPSYPWALLMLCSWVFSFDVWEKMDLPLCHTNERVMGQSKLQDSSHSSETKKPKQILGWLLRNMISILSTHILFIHSSTQQLHLDLWLIGFLIHYNPFWDKDTKLSHSITTSKGYKTCVLYFFWRRN